MIARLLTFLFVIRSSLWALPLAMAVSASLLAYLALRVKLDPGNHEAWYLYSGDAEEASAFLSNLVTAMITMATLAISITMVVLTLAAQQLGPRLIRSFMGDRRTQLSLGLFVATVIYLLVVLRGAYALNDSVPNLAVTAGTALVLLSVAALLLFVHHLARSIIADNVIEKVGAQLDRDIKRLLPEDASEKIETVKPPKRAYTIPFAYGGIVQAIDFESIVNAASGAGVVVELAARAGNFAVPGSDLAYVSAKPKQPDAFARIVQNAVVTGGERTAVQDIEYSVHQLVEIALRALSPGINDPYTANSVVDRLTLSLSNAMVRGKANSVCRDSAGDVRLLTPISTFEGITDAAFNQIRQQAANMPSVLIRMVENIVKLIGQAGAAHRATLEMHLKLVVNTGRRSIADEYDLKALNERADAVKTITKKKRKKK